MYRTTKINGTLKLIECPTSVFIGKFSDSRVGSSDGLNRYELESMFPNTFSFAEGIVLAFYSVTFAKVSITNSNGQIIFVEHIGRY